jgi:UDP-N-acetyl-2-amino-2-deoxyglucuronate dehydrogenase
MIKVALVVCGRIAERHASILGERQVAGICLGAVCDLTYEKARRIGQKYDVPAYDDMHMMAQQQDIDIFAVLTPSGMHARHVLELVQYKKHIIVEKPMALTLQQADKMIHGCDQAGVRLFVVKQNRFNLPVQKLREAMEAGRFGKLVMGTVRVRWCRRQDYYDQDDWRGTWAYDGGVLANQASHHIDLLEWMMGDVRTIFAKATTALVNIECEDTAVVVLTFQSGALGIIEATTATRPKDTEGSISILGEKGMVEIGGFAVNEMRIWQFEDSSEEDRVVLEKFSTNPPNVYGFGHTVYYRQVVDCIRSGAPQLVDGLEGRRSLELITAIYESIETGKEVSMRFVPLRCRLGLEAG